MLGVGRDLCGSSSPTLLPKQGHLQQAAQDCVQAGLEYLQWRGLHNLPGQPVPVLRHPQREEMWRKEGGGLRPTRPSPVAIHLPECLRKVPSSLRDSIVKPKVPVSRESIVLLHHTEATRALGQWWKLSHLNSTLIHLPKVTSQPVPTSPESSPRSSTSPKLSSRDHMQP